MELKFKGQHEEPAPLPMIINKIKWKKSESIENVEEGHNTWYTGRVTVMNITNG